MTQLTKSHQQQTIKQIVEVLSGYSADQVYLYGSYAQDKARDDSDIDVLVITNSDDDSYSMKLSAAFFRERLPVELLVLSRSVFQERLKWNFFLQDIVNDGIQLV